MWLCSSDGDMMVQSVCDDAAACLKDPKKCVSPHDNMGVVIGTQPCANV